MAIRVAWMTSDGNGGTTSREVVCTTRGEQRRAEQQARTEAGTFRKLPVRNGHRPTGTGRDRATRRKSSRVLVLATR